MQQKFTCWLAKFYCTFEPIFSTDFMVATIFSVISTAQQYRVLQKVLHMLLCVYNLLNVLIPKDLCLSETYFSDILRIYK